MNHPLDRRIFSAGQYINRREQRPHRAFLLGRIGGRAARAAAVLILQAPRRALDRGAAAVLRAQFLRARDFIQHREMPRAVAQIRQRSRRDAPRLRAILRTPRPRAAARRGRVSRQRFEFHARPPCARRAAFVRIVRQIRIRCLYRAVEIAQKRMHAQLPFKRPQASLFI